MSSDQIEGDVKKGVGRLQDAAGGLMGSDETQAQGKMNEAAGSVQDAVGKVKSLAQDTVGQVKDRAQDAMGEARDKAQDTFERVADYSKAQPLQALGIALGIGVVVGFMLHGGRRVVYASK